MVNVAKVMREVFTNVQFSKTCHQSNKKKLKKLYDRVALEIFSENFIKCLQIPLTKGERHPHVENTLDFAAKFAVSLYSVEIENVVDEAMCPFLICLLDFLLAHHGTSDLVVRFRVCHFLNILLNSMGDKAFINDHLCDKITSSMMDRVLDKSPKVRAQAVLVLNRLQDPFNENCPVIKVYIFHLSKDPSSEVRKAVLSSMAKNHKTFLAVLRRTRDTDEYVRKMAYEYISKITVKSMRINQREALLNDGLKDRSEVVRKTVRNVLLPAWLLSFEAQYLTLLRALDAENATETAILALNVLFKSDSLTKLLGQLPVNSETRLIPFNKLTSESVLYWRCLIEHLQRESMSEEVELCVPELTKFCDYIREFLTVVENEKDESEQLTLQFILHQLFKITETYDLSDEIGRSILRQLIVDTLLSDYCSVKVTRCIVEHFENVVPDVDDRLSTLAHVVSEIRITTRQIIPTQISEEDADRKKIKRAKLKVQLNEIQELEYEAIQSRNFLKAQELKEQIEGMEKEIEELTDTRAAAIIENVSEEKNDPDTMIKCLEIMCSAITVNSVTTLTATLRSLLENLAIPSIDNENSNVHMLALKAVSTCCLLDKQLAKKHIMMFLLQFSLDEDDRQIWIVALEAIFDLLLEFGLEFFDIVQDNNNGTETADRSRRNGPVRLYNHTEEDITGVSVRSDDNDDGKNKFIKVLISLLDNGDQELRTIATEGLCKLLLHRRITGAQLLSRLIILMHNPVNAEDFYIHQCLCNFFKLFARSVPDSQEMLEQSFMMTLKTLANAPSSSPLRGIDPCNVAEVILGLTSSRNYKPGSESYTVHNNLAMAILAETLDPTSEIDLEVMIKALKYVDVRFEDNTLKENLREAADKIEESLRGSDKRLIKYIHQFKSKFDAIEPMEGDNQENIAPNEQNEPNERNDLNDPHEHLSDSPDER